MADINPQNQNEMFLLEAWVLDNPGSHLFRKLAQLYYNQDRLAEAAGVLQRGLAIHSNDVEARSLLAEVLQAMGDLPGAVNQLQIAAGEIKRHAGIFTRLAELSEIQGDSGYAANSRQIADALNSEKAPRSISAPVGEDTVTMAEIYAAQGHIGQAQEIYRRLLDKDPGRADLRQRLEALSGQAGELDSPAQKAIEQLTALKQAAMNMAL